MVKPEDYQTELFRKGGFSRKKCVKCGTYFWTLDSKKECCGDPPCEEYTFIGKSPLDRKYDLQSMRERFLSFFEKKGHKRVGRYPVIARWRDDVFFTQASIYGFQPWVINRTIEPPANPLTISQPCIRFNDIDNVGKTGRHLTLFEMMAHHVFNFPEKEIYFKDRTVELAHELFTKGLGIKPEEITYKEAWWEGGGNAGPCFEGIVGGIELCTLVFMQYNGPVNGKYTPMDVRVVDTGYGLERMVWLSQGTPTAYDAIFPEIIKKLKKEAGVEKYDHKLMGEYAKMAGMMSISDLKDLKELRARAAKRVGMDVDELVKFVKPYENIFAIADHAKALTFMLSDGLIPSNVKAGYFARMLARKVIRYLRNLGISEKLGEIVDMQISDLKKQYPEFAESRDSILKILDHEEERYAETLRRGKLVVAKIDEKNPEKIPLKDLIQLYDSFGLQPSDVEEFSRRKVEVPDNFYTLISEQHSQVETEKKEEKKIIAQPTKVLFYDDPYGTEFKAKILDIIEKNGVILERTMFYAEAGGQVSDRGSIEGKRVEDVQKYGQVFVHYLKDVKGLSKGQTALCKVDPEWRMALMRHHTATHIINGAARRILGKHVWQTGAFKEKDKARLDITHYERITQEELDEIERLANMVVMETRPVTAKFMERNEAEKKYGFTLYQGGAVPGKVIRVVDIRGWDTEACGGTHVANTGEVGPIKIIRSERIQDGVERLIYCSGDEAVRFIQKRFGQMQKASDELGVSPDQLEQAVQKFFNEWKERGKEIERMKKGAGKAIAEGQKSVSIRGLRGIFIHIPDSEMPELVEAGKKLSKENSIVVLTGGKESGVVLALCDDKALSQGFDAVTLADRVAKELGGKAGGNKKEAKGGGKNIGKIEQSLEKIKKELSSP